jgi:hypothetical protein
MMQLRRLANPLFSFLQLYLIYLLPVTLEVFRLVKIVERVLNIYFFNLE